MGYSVFPMVCTLLCVCLLRILWICTVFPVFHTITGLYAAWPVTKGIASIAATAYILPDHGKDILLFMNMYISDGIISFRATGHGGSFCIHMATVEHRVFIMIRHVFTDRKETAFSVVSSL